MNRTTIVKHALALTTSLCLISAIGVAKAGGHGDKKDMTKMTPEQLAEHLIFNSGSFKLDQEVQEGGVSKQRLVQDDLQKACSVKDKTKLDPATTV